jgi:hypothetical protein
VGSLQMLSIGEALDDKSGDLRRSSRMLSSLLSPSWSLMLLNVELLRSDRLNSSAFGDEISLSLLRGCKGSVGVLGVSLSVELVDSNFLDVVGSNFSCSAKHDIKYEQFCNSKCYK